MKKETENWIRIRFIVSADTIRHGLVDIPASVEDMPRRDRIQYVNQAIRQRLVEEGVPLIKRTVSKYDLVNPHKGEPYQYELDFVVMSAKKIGNVVYRSDGVELSFDGEIPKGPCSPMRRFKNALRRFLPSISSSR